MLHFGTYKPNDDDDDDIYSSNEEDYQIENELINSKKQKIMKECETANWFMHLHDIQRKKDYFVNISNIESICIDKIKTDLKSLPYLDIRTVVGNYRCFINVKQEIDYRDRLRNNNLMEFYVGSIMCNAIEFKSNQRIIEE